MATSSSSHRVVGDRRDRGPGADPALDVLRASPPRTTVNRSSCSPRDSPDRTYAAASPPGISRGRNTARVPAGLREPVEPEGAPVVALEVVRRAGTSAGRPSPAGAARRGGGGPPPARCRRARCSRTGAAPGRGSPGRPSPAPTRRPRAPGRRARRRWPHATTRHGGAAGAGSTCTTFDSADSEASERVPPKALARALQGDHHRDRLVLVDDQRRHRAAGRQLVAAVDPAVGVDRVAEVAQPLDVAAQRPLGHLEPARQLGAGPEPVGLQQRQQPQRPGARVRHVDPESPTMRSGTDRKRS